MVSEKLILVTGGCRSGKSEFAEQIANTFTGPVKYLATLKADDEEFKLRVKKHRERRPASWTTLEEELMIPELLERECKNGVVLLDSLSGWLTNMMYECDRETFEEKEARILLRVERFVRVTQMTKATVIVVADEVGFGLVPPYPEGRIFRDLNGKANQIVAGAADKVYLVISGIPLQIK